MVNSALKEKLIAFTAQRYHVQADKNLNDYVFSNYLFHSYDPTLVAFMFAHRQEISALYSDETQIQEFIDFCIRSTKQYTYKRNQYINYPKEYEGLLQGEYRDFLLQIKSLVERASSPDDIARALSLLLSRHHERLRLILASYCISYQKTPLERNGLLQTVTCEEYSAPLQLQVLHIDIEQLAEPILDVGCGSEGTLVRYLREQGLEAFGMDRLAPYGSEFLQKDWFDFDSAQSWGTVIAHQSISTHFIYHHLQNSQMAKKYAQLFTSILAGLDRSGTFYYAPGLPFFEAWLEESEQYAITRNPLAIDTFGIGEIAYATKIQLKSE